jgi:addiction module HigA family antidote
MSQHPGHYLSEIIRPERKKDFAKRLGVSRQTLWELLNEKQRVELAMAERLARVTDKSARFWLQMQLDFDVSQAKRRQ